MIDEGIFSKAGKDIQEIAEKINKSEAQVEENSRAIKEIFSALEDTPITEDDIDALASMLSLPDDSFKIFAPIFMAELEKAYTSTEQRAVLIQALNASDIKIEDLTDSFIEIQKEINDIPNEEFSLVKKDFLNQLFSMTYNSIAELDGVDKRRLFVPIEFCNENAKYPAYAHESDAGMDVYALEDITIHPGETKLIPIGVKVAIPAGYELQVRPKSGRCLKTKLRVANAPGTIDSGYRDEIGVIVDNIDPFIKEAKISEDGKITEVLYGSDYTIGKGEKFAQLVLSEVPKVMWVKSEDVSVLGEDRNGGFGSTGLK